MSGDEALAFGLANRLVEPGHALDGARALAEALSGFPPLCLRHDRASVLEQWSLPLVDALANEVRHGLVPVRAGETLSGAGRFSAGEGRHGAGV